MQTRHERMLCVGTTSIAWFRYKLCVELLEPSAACMLARPLRLREPPFDQAIELHERERWVLHPSVREAVDAYYSGEPHKVRVGKGEEATAQ